MSETIAIPLNGATIVDYEAIANDFKIVEFVKGDIIVTPPQSIKHQLIISKLMTVLGSLLDKNEMVVLSAPIGLKLPSNEVLEPDVLVLRNMNNETIQGNYIVEPFFEIIQT